MPTPRARVSARAARRRAPGPAKRARPARRRRSTGRPLGRPGPRSAVKPLKPADAGRALLLPAAHPEQHDHTHGRRGRSPMSRQRHSHQCCAPRGRSSWSSWSSWCSTSSPSQASRPSWMAKTAMTKPATGSSQAAPVSANRASPRSVEMLSRTQIRVSAASARISGSPPSRIGDPPFCPGQQWHHHDRRRQQHHADGRVVRVLADDQVADAFDGDVGGEEEEGDGDQPQCSPFPPFVGLAVAAAGRRAAARPARPRSTRCRSPDQTRPGRPARRPGRR